LLFFSDILKKKNNFIIGFLFFFKNDKKFKLMNIQISNYFFN
jgi:hypothetical protein